MNEITKPAEPLNMAEYIQKVENFQKVLNNPPTPSHIKSNPYANNAQYIPIEILEMRMDELFMGLWSSRVISSKVIGNAVTYDIEVNYFHPTAKIWLTRAGSGACQIELQAHKYDKNKVMIREGARNALDFERMNASAIEKNAPNAKAMAFRNAVQSIGKSFGRDLNRDLDHAAQYSKPYTTKLTLMAQRAAQEAQEITDSLTKKD